MKQLSSLFYNIVKEIFWKFLKEFWGFVKKDLLKFLRETAESIIKNKLKKIKGIIGGLIQILTKIIQTNIGSCTDLFNAILDAISAIMNKKVNIPIPGMLLSLSNKLPGYSTDRAYMDIVERMQSAGINTEEIYGEPNKFVQAVKSQIEGHQSEMDTNAYVEAAVSDLIVTIPASMTSAYIYQGAFKVAGKVF